MIFAQIFDMVNVGIVILDKELKVYKWNRWMEIHSKISAQEIIGVTIFDFFPEMKNPRFLRNVKSVLTFGNFAFFSQKLHKYIFPFKASNSQGTNFIHMRQSCTMGPLRDENNRIQYVYIMVQDVTDVAAYEQKLIEMSIKDGLTGVYNRRFLESRLAEEFERHKRYLRPLSIIMQDIDFFKGINDTYSHPCGDYILKTFASLIGSTIRKVDIFARYGGEEFCCVLPETGLESATKLAEHLRRKVEDEIFRFNETEIKITVSQGVAELKKETVSAEELLRRADDALYEAKETGRNKVVGLCK